MRLAPALFLSLALPLFAGDDVSFAQALAERGWFDLARAACEELRNDSLAPAAERAAADLAAAGIVRAEAQAEGDAARKDSLFEEAQKQAQAFLAASPDNPRADEARLLIGEVARDRAQAFAAKGDRPHAEEQLNAADEAFARVVRGRSASQRRDAVLLRAAYDHALAPFLRATQLETGARRKDLLSSAVKGMDEFAWEFDGALAAYDLAVFEGQACAELGQMEKACASFDSAIGLKESSRTARSIVLRAYWAKAKACADVEDGRKWWVVARDTVDQMEQYCAASPEDEATRRWHRLALVEKARAFAKLGDAAAAVRVAEKVAAEDGPWQEEAKRILAEAKGEAVEGPAPPAPVEPPEPASAAGERLEREGKWADAADAFRRVPEKAEGYDLALAHLAYCEYQVGREACDDAQRNPERRVSLLGQARDAFARAEGDLRALQDRSQHPEALAKVLLFRAELFVSLCKEDPSFLDKADAAVQDLALAHLALAPEADTQYHDALQRLQDRVAALKEHR